MQCRLSTPNGLPDPYKNALDVTNFVAQVTSPTSVFLTWTIPAGSNPTAIRILRKTNGFPANKDDGAIIYDALGTSATDTGLTSNTQYYYAAFAYSWIGYVSAGVRMGAYPNNQVPSLVASTPTDSATNITPCSGNPCRARIILQFSESMNTALPQTMTTDIWDGAAYVSAPVSVSTTAWSSTLNYNDTVTLLVSWLWFPENSQIRYTLPAANIQDSFANAIIGQIQRSFTTATAKQDFKKPDSGQTGCYNDTVSQACPVASHPGQDADFMNVPNARSFTGPAAHAVYLTDYTTTDNVTGLVWNSCVAGLSGPTCATGTAITYTWYNALNQCSVLNSLNGGNGYAGRTTWRLPTPRELETLPNFNVPNPAIDTANFPAMGGLDDHWSSGTRLDALTSAWLSLFSSDGRTIGTVKTGNYRIRCVSAEPVVDAATYTDNADGTITNKTTGLRWQKCSRGKNNDSTCSGTATTATWQTALQYCDALTLGNFANAGNWRLPNVTELLTLVDRSVFSPAISASFFPATTTGNYWTSTTNYNSTATAWAIDFVLGGSTPSGAKTASNSVRCVATEP